MIYFDAAYVAKCYLNEPGADRVRRVAYDADGLASCECARLEFAGIVRRHAQERRLTRREAAAILAEFVDDERSGVWRWLGVTPALIGRARESVARLPARVFIRTLDVLHLECARDHGFREVYTNDRHMLSAARHFHLVGIDVVNSP